MSYVDIFETYTAELLNEYENSEICFFEMYLNALKQEADRHVKQNNQYRRGVSRVEEATTLSILLGKLDVSMVSLSANVDKLRNSQQRQKNATELYFENDITNAAERSADINRRCLVASLEEQVYDIRRRRSTLQDDLAVVQRRNKHFVSELENSARQLDAENAAELETCRASAEKEIRQFRGELTIAIEEKRRKVESIEAEAKLHHSVHANCDKLLRQEQRRFSKLENAANKRLVTVQKAYGKMLYEVEDQQGEAVVSGVSNTQSPFGCWPESSTE